jgi:tetratricopeptide (TPR) repeat protein
MSAPRRARLHRRVAAALEGGGEDGDRLAALAHHFTRAAAGQDDARKAIEYAIRAAESADAVLAYEEAAGHYAGALAVLERFRPGASDLRCALLLALGEAQLRAGERPTAGESFRQAAALATELGDHDALARAALGASDRYIQPPGVQDLELIALLERALAVAATEASLPRVQLLARLCGALYYADGRERMAALSAEARGIAAQLGDPEARAYACAAARRAHWEPVGLTERLAASTEMLTCARAAGNLELELQAHAWLSVDLMESGDLDAVDAQLEAFADGAERVRQPLYLWNATVWRAMRAALGGRLEEAERVATEALSTGSRAEPVTAPQWYAIQLLTIRSEQLRLVELRDGVRQAAGATRVPAWRAAYAWLLTEVGELDEARAEFDALAADEFAEIPPDGNWVAAIAMLAHPCARLGDAARARVLQRLLEPFADRTIQVGMATANLGSVRRELGVLAAAAGRRDEAVAHYERAIEVNRKLGARAYLAHSQLELAALLGPADGRVAGLIAEVEQTLDALPLPAVAAKLGSLRRALGASQGGSAPGTGGRGR